MKIAELMTAMPASVKGTVSREAIEGTIMDYCATYASADVKSRLDLLANDIEFHDPVGNQVGSDKESTEKFFRDTIGLGFSMDLKPERIIVNGNEALVVATLVAKRDESDTAVLDLHIRIVVDDDGLISYLGTFFDESCVSAGQ